MRNDTNGLFSKMQVHILSADRQKMEIAILGWLGQEPGLGLQEDFRSQHALLVLSGSWQTRCSGNAIDKKPREEFKRYDKVPEFNAEYDPLCDGLKVVQVPEAASISFKYNVNPIKLTDYLS